MVNAAGAPADKLARLAPGLAMLRGYQFGWLRVQRPRRPVSRPAVAVPVAIAYAQLAGFPPVVGLYVSILPMIVLHGVLGRHAS